MILTASITTPDRFSVPFKPQEENKEDKSVVNNIALKFTDFIWDVLGG